MLRRRTHITENPGFVEVSKGIWEIETVFWIELLVETGIVKESRLKNLLTGAKELTAIFAVSQRTTKYRPRRSATQSGVGLMTQPEKGAVTQ
jgi:hypothetical protein